MRRNRSRVDLSSNGTEGYMPDLKQFNVASPYVSVNSVTGERKMVDPNMPEVEQNKATGTLDQLRNLLDAPEDGEMMDAMYNHEEAHLVSIPEPVGGWRVSLLCFAVRATAGDYWQREEWPDVWRREKMFHGLRQLQLNVFPTGKENTRRELMNYYLHNIQEMWGSGEQHGN